MTHNQEKLISIDKDQSGLRLLVGAFLVSLLIPGLIISIFFNFDIGAIIILTMLTLPLLKLMCAKANLSIDSDVFIISSDYFKKKVKEYRVEDFSVVKCVVSSHFHGYGSGTSTHIRLELERRGVDRFNMDDVSLQEFYGWNVTNQSKKRRRAISDEVNLVLSEISEVTGLSIKIEEKAKRYILTDL